VLLHWLNDFVLLFVVVDPLCLAPAFVALTQGAGPLHVRRMALRGTGLGTAILVVFALLGQGLLGVLRISFAAMRVSGGALLFLLAIDMVFARQSGLRSTTPGEQEEASHKDDISVFPLAIPLFAGPGAITTVMLLASESAGQRLHLAAILGLLLILGLITLGALLLAARIMRLLGETGLNVISRVSGIVLAALAAQYIIDGVRASIFP